MNGGELTSKRAAPSWWNDHHTRRWERAKAAFSESGEVERELRFGYGASSYYSDHLVWDLALEAKLRDDWQEVDDSRDWSSVRDDVRRGWDYARGIR